MVKQSVLLLAFTVSLASCVKEYDCHCTYVPNTLGPNAGQPNKEEHSTVGARTSEDADVECMSLTGKYISQFYSGT